jgi:hypothetical protein
MRTMQGFSQIVEPYFEYEWFYCLKVHAAYARVPACQERLKMICIYKCRGLRLSKQCRQPILQSCSVHKLEDDNDLFTNREVRCAE